MKRALALFVRLQILTLTIGCVQTSFAAEVPTAQRMLNEFLKPLVERGLFSGSVVIREDGQVTAELNAGYANRELHVPVNASTKFYVASITKSFTAAAILRLREAGKVDLNDPLKKYLPEFPHGDVTVRQLLTHTSGFQHPVFFPDFYDLAKRSYTTEEAALLFKDRPLVSAPGTTTRYSDYNYILLARVIEVASGEPYGDYLAAHFFRPLQLTSAGTHTGWSAIVLDRAAGYQPIRIRDFQNSPYFDYSIDTGAASIFMSAADLARWVEAIGSGRVLNSEDSAELTGSAERRGLLGNTQVSAKQALTLTGWDNIGFGSAALYFPEVRLSIAVTINENNSGLATYVAGELAKGYLAGVQAPPPEFSREPIETTQYLGVYRFGKDFYVPGQEMEIVSESGELFERQHRPERMIGLLAMSDGSFRHRSHWGRITFEKKGSRIGGLEFDGFKAEKIR